MRAGLCEGCSGTPGHDRAVGFERHSVIPTRRHGHDITESFRWALEAPGYHSAVCFERNHPAVGTCIDGDHPAQAIGNRRLSSPSNNGAIRL